MWLFGFHVAMALDPRLPADLPSDVLAEAAPSGWAPFDLGPEDVTVRWLSGSAPEGVDFALEPGSVQWVRVGEVLVVPRARFAVHVDAADGGVVDVSGTSTPLGRDEAPSTDGGAVGEVEMALIMGSLPGELRWTADGEEHRAAFSLVAGEGAVEARRDVSCSRWRLDVEAVEQGTTESWAYFGCEASTVRDPLGDAYELRVLLFWNGAGDVVTADGVRLVPVAPQVWDLRLKPSGGPLELASAQTGQKLRVAYDVPERQHALVLGGALGGAVRSDVDATYGVTALRLHAIYLVDDERRIVVFDTFLFPLGPNAGVDLDLGGYYEAPFLSWMDGRARISTLLGAHLQRMDAQREGAVKFSAPQGVELMVPDAFAPSWWWRAGAFAQPPVADRWYLQAYLRYGLRAFVELNATAWQLPTTDGEVVRRRYVGVLVGTPLGRAL